MVRNYHQLGVTCRASFRTPWNATSRTTAEDALWQHTLGRYTSSQPLVLAKSCTRSLDI